MGYHECSRCSASIREITGICPACKRQDLAKAQAERQSREAAQQNEALLQVAAHAAVLQAQAAKKAAQQHAELSAQQEKLAQQNAEMAANQRAIIEQNRQARLTPEEFAQEKAIVAELQAKTHQLLRLLSEEESDWAEQSLTTHSKNMNAEELYAEGRLKIRIARESLAKTKAALKRAADPEERKARIAATEDRLAIEAAARIAAEKERVAKEAADKEARAAKEAADREAQLLRQARFKKYMLLSLISLILMVFSLFSSLFLHDTEIVSPTTLGIILNVCRFTMLLTIVFFLIAIWNPVAKNTKLD